MPDAQDYREAAGRLRGLAGQLGHHGRLLRLTTDPATFAGGPLADRLGHMLETHLRAAAHAADELLDLASVCDRRAEICEQDAAEPERRRLVRTLEPFVPMPVTPVWWAAS